MKTKLHFRVSFAVLVAASLTFSGCSSKKYFEPEQTFSASLAKTSYGEVIVDQSRSGATLQSGKYIGRAGISKINLGKDYRFLSESSIYILATNPLGELKIIKKSSGSTLRTVQLDAPVVSATINKGVIAYILNNNSYGLYNVSNNKKLIQNQSEATFAIDTRAAMPMFIENLAVFPMLDGKLIVVDKNNPENSTIIYLSSQNAFNNVIFLSRTGNTMVSATSKKIITVGVDGQEELRANISDVALLKGYIYLFTKEGEIVKLDKTLNEIGRKKFKFVHFSASTVYAGKIYGLDRKGSLIVINKNLTKYKIYDIDEVEKPVFIMGSKLYKDGEIIDLSKLGYE